MIRLEAFVLHRSNREQDGKWYSLGVFECAYGSHGAGRDSKHRTYEQNAENFRKRAQFEYGRPVELRPA